MRLSIVKPNETDFGVSSPASLRYTRAVLSAGAPPFEASTVAASRKKHGRAREG